MNRAELSWLDTHPCMRPLPQRGAALRPDRTLLLARLGAPLVLGAAASHAKRPGHPFGYRYCSSEFGIGIRSLEFGIGIRSLQYLVFG
jgi:hypothetical protein